MFFFFSAWGREKGEAEAPGREGVGFFIENPRGFSGERGGGGEGP